MKEFHILAIDGGGSKGLMEALIIQDVMRAATFIMQNPTKVLEIMKKECPNPSEQKYSYVFDYGNIETRQKFIDEMLKIEEGKLIHPTEVFDMICGTSVGALMAFGIVGGKKDDLNGERVAMSMQEVVDFMVNTTNKIWPASGKWTAFWNTIKSCAFRLYSSDGVETTLEETFGDASLTSFKNQCIAAAVARRMASKDADEDECFDCLEIFDTHPSSEDIARCKVTEVLKASSNAPIYFKTPSYVTHYQEGPDGEEELPIPYVDGGLGGNCPAPQALRRMKEIFRGRKLGTTLSIAPPRSYDHAEANGLIYWLKYFPNQTTDGMTYYEEFKKMHPKGTCQRIYPRSKEAKEFKTNDTRVEKMKDVMEQERLRHPTYMQEIVSAAIVIAARRQNKDVAKLWQIAESFVDASLENAVAMKKAQLNLDNELGILNAMSKIEGFEMRNQILLKLADVQCHGKLTEEAEETLEKVKLDVDNMDEEIKKKIEEIELKINAKRVCTKSNMANFKGHPKIFIAVHPNCDS